MVSVLIEFRVRVEFVRHIGNTNKICYHFQVNSECLIKYPLNITIESVGSDHILEIGPCQLGGAQSSLTKAPSWCPMIVNHTAQSDWSTVSATLTNISVLAAHTRYTLLVLVSNVFGNVSSDSFSLSKLAIVYNMCDIHRLFYRYCIC